GLYTNGSWLAQCIDQGIAHYGILIIERKGFIYLLVHLFIFHTVSLDFILNNFFLGKLNKNKNKNNEILPIWLQASMMKRTRMQRSCFLDSFNMAEKLLKTLILRGKKHNYVASTTPRVQYLNLFTPIILVTKILPACSRKNLA
ncbi:hypothetical protein ACJX0J_037047, partial [Zea mays]